ncbi:hypothetical protein V9L05_01215 [Bernardetia sp. Wsw4-3y2]|uniref:hypothetical protein n=1 Tax=Bernardetia sp. Wsw4-3y2 TaxID=3127471 RepID=UPI0030D1D630
MNALVENLIKQKHPSDTKIKIITKGKEYNYDTFDFSFHKAAKAKVSDTRTVLIPIEIDFNESYHLFGISFCITTEQLKSHPNFLSDCVFLNQGKQEHKMILQTRNNILELFNLKIESQYFFDVTRFVFLIDPKQHGKLQGL